MRYIICQLALSLFQNDWFCKNKDCQLLLYFVLRVASTHPQEIKDKRGQKAEGFETDIQLLVNSAR